MTGWIIVASGDHVERGRAGSFIQVNHGKIGPLKRILPGDRVICYSPSTKMTGGVPLQAFTAAGIVAEGAPYPCDMGHGFVPFRRNVIWFGGFAAPIKPMLDELEFTRGKTNWGYQFRFGAFKISDDDLVRITSAMQVA